MYAHHLFYGNSRLEAITSFSSPEIYIDALKLEKGREHPLFITARQTDQSRIWTSPLFRGL